MSVLAARTHSVATTSLSATERISGRSIARSAALALGLLSACTDPLTSADSTSTGDSDTGWNSADAADGGIGEKTRCVVVATSEFRGGGSIATVDADSMRVRRDITATHQDAVVRVRNGRVFVLNREGADSVQELDPYAGYRTLWQRSVGNGTNPWDLQLLQDGHAWVTLYNTGAMQLVDTRAESDASFLLQSPVELPEWTDDDHKVEPAGAVLWDGVLYVLVQGLDDYPRCAEGSRGYLHAFDATTLEPVPAFGDAPFIELARCNPTSFHLDDNGVLMVGLAGMYRSLSRPEDMHDDGGVEMIDLTTGETSGLLLNEADTGGRDVAGVASAPDGRMWLALADESFGADIVEAHVDADGSVVFGDSLWHSPTGGIFDLEYKWDRVWIADRSPDAPGLVVLNADTGEVVGSGPMDTGFPPYDIDFIELPAGTGCGR
jgi:hypothetical protein